MEFELKVFDPKTATQESWDVFHVFRKAYHDVVRPDDPMQPDEIAQRNMLVQIENPEFHFKFYGIYEKNKPDALIGTYIHIWFKEDSDLYKENPDLAIVEMQLLPEFRRRGIGTYLTKLTYEKLNDVGKKIIMSNTEEADGREFAKFIGAKEALASLENRLQLKDLDWDMMKDWVTNGESKNQSTQLKYLFTIPEDIIEHYAEVYTETLKQVPLGELQIEPIQTPKMIRKLEKDFEATEKTQLTVISVEEDGNISGLSELIFNPHLNMKLSQNLTSVREQYRGNGIGKWVKAAALLKARELWPTVDFISTGNATSNEPMLAINDKMGFKVYKEMFSIQTTLDELKKFVDRLEVSKIAV